MKLLVFSDIHNDWKALDRILAIEADYYIAAGDQVTWGKGLDRAGEILAQRADKMYVLPGNHESAEMTAAMRASFTDCTISTSATSKSVNGTSPVWDTRARLHSIRRENTAKPRSPNASVPFAPLTPLILICHAPPYGTALDQIKPGLHAGSQSVRAFIEQHQPAHFFCGHIHEAEGVAIQMGSTHAMNVGKAGYLLELD